MGREPPAGPPSRGMGSDQHRTRSRYLRVTVRQMRNTLTMVTRMQMVMKSSRMSMEILKPGKNRKRTTRMKRKRRRY